MKKDKTAKTPKTETKPETTAAEAVLERKAVVRKLSEIKIPEDHFRKKLGNLNGLAASIQKVGLIHPLLIDASNNLIAGYRRISAIKQIANGEDVEIRCTVAKDLDDAVLRLIAERDENTEREELTPSEAVKLARRLEALEKPQAEARQKESRATKGEQVGKKRARAGSSEKGRTIERVSKAVGMSRENLRKAKEVVSMAEAEPEKYGDLAKEMDETGKIHPAHTKARERAGKAKPAPAFTLPKGVKVKVCCQACGATFVLAQDDIVA